MSKPVIVLVRSTPSDQAQLHTDAELDVLLRPGAFEILPNVKVRLWELPKILKEAIAKIGGRSSVLHLSGHGSRNGEFYFEEASDAFPGSTESEPANVDGLRKLVEAAGRFTIVSVSACDSATLAQALTTDSSFTVGIDGKIDQAVANAFFGAFYSSLAMEASAIEAFDEAKDVLEASARYRASADAFRWFVPLDTAGKPLVDPHTVFLVPPQETRLDISFSQGPPTKPVPITWTLSSDVFVEVAGHLAKRDVADIEIAYPGSRPQVFPLSTVPARINIGNVAKARLTTRVVTATVRVIEGARVGARQSRGSVHRTQASASVSVVPTWAVLVAIASFIPAIFIVGLAAFASVGYTATLTTVSAVVLPLFSIVTPFVVLALQRAQVIDRNPLELVLRRPPALLGIAAFVGVVPFASSQLLGTLVVNLSGAPLKYGSDEIGNRRARIVFGDIRTETKGTCFEGEPACKMPHDDSRDLDEPIFGRFAGRRKRAGCRNHTWEIAGFSVTGEAIELQLKQSTCEAEPGGRTVSLRLSKLAGAGSIAGADGTIVALPQMDAPGFFDVNVFRSIIDQWAPLPIDGDARQATFSWKGTGPMRDANTQPTQAGGVVVRLPREAEIAIDATGKGQQGILTIHQECVGLHPAVPPRWLGTMSIHQTFDWKATSGAAAFWIPCTRASTPPDGSMSLRSEEEPDRALEIPRSLAATHLTVSHGGTQIGTLSCEVPETVSTVMIGRPEAMPEYCAPSSNIALVQNVRSMWQPKAGSTSTIKLFCWTKGAACSRPFVSDCCNDDTKKAISCPTPRTVPPCPRKLKRPSEGGQDEGYPAACKWACP